MYLFSTLMKIIYEGEFHSLVDELEFKISSRRWRRKYKDFDHYYKNRQWEEAIHLGIRALALEKNDPLLHQKIAHSYLKINEMEKGTLHMKQAFNLVSQSEKEELISLLTDSVFINHLNFESEYSYLGGRDNLGFIKHQGGELKDKRYITKIVPISYPLNHFAQKEAYFYDEILTHYPIFKDFVPEMIHSMVSENKQFLLMTFPKLKNDGISRDNFEDLILIYKNMATAIPYQDLVKRLKLTDKGKAEALSSLMHKASSHRIILRKMRRQIKDLEQASDLAAIINQLETIILGSEVYRKIQPAGDYVFSHQDFNENNILYDKDKERYYIIDWSSYGLALKGADLAKLFSSCQISFKEIEQNYLDLIFSHQESRLKLFFVYELFLQWFKRYNLEKTDELIENYFQPAMDYLEKLLRETNI